MDRLVIRDLIDKLNYYTKLYDEGHPEISDKEWDELYFKLKKAEKRSGIIYPDSPTQNIHFERVSELKKVKHNHPMLSLDKTKDIKEIESFLKGHDLIAMAKMDGLTCSLHYLDGKLISAETRGNGIEGEDITHNAMVISSIPKIIERKEDIIIDGEIICTYDNFKPFKDKYKNPRNFASGSIRLLDSKECAKRNLTFVAWDIIKGGKYDYLSNNLSSLRTYGFEIVPMFINGDGVDLTPIEDYINSIKRASKDLSYPIDGVVFKYDTIKEYEAAGRTDHHFKGGLAYKFYDETYSTRLRYITWTMGRTGILTPVAEFDPVEIDGTEVSRASLHNVSIMREILGDCAYVGEPLEVFKSNMIIPQIYSAGPKYNYGEVIAKGGVSANDSIETCPICDHHVSYITENGITRAYCTNPLCEGKFINKLEHFCGKKGLDIKGLSKATFEKLIDWGWVNNIIDIFNLSQYKNEWIKKPGFGVASVNKILNSIEEHKNTTLDAFISAIGIPLIGKTVAKTLANQFQTYEQFRNAVKDKNYYFFIIDGFGEEMHQSLKKFDYTEADNIANLLIFQQPVKKVENNNQNLLNKVIVITGKLNHYKNRNELKNIIEQHGGKVSDTISSKTAFLINNDINSDSTKNKNARNKGIPILSEADFIAQYIEKS